MIQISLSKSIVYSLKCGKCRCGKCATRVQKLHMQEERQLKMVNEGLNYDPDEKDWICQFLWTKNSKDILNNFPFALLRLRVKKIRLNKLSKSHYQAYDAEIKDNIDRSLSKKLSSLDLKKQHAPVHYIPNHEF